jgi:hypothetical protein
MLAPIPIQMCVAAHSVNTLDGGIFLSAGAQFLARLVLVSQRQYDSAACEKWGKVLKEARARAE